MRYEPDRSPDPAEWLALAEPERRRLVAEAHLETSDAHPKVAAKRAHAIYHVMIENQVAEGEPPEVGGALARLVANGMGRHEALHAVAAALAAETWGMLNEKRSFDTGAYRERLRTLGAAG